MIFQCQRGELTLEEELEHWYGHAVWWFVVDLVLSTWTYVQIGKVVPNMDSQ